MKKELQKNLIRDFPLTFNLSSGTNFTMFGFECGDGWEPLIRKYAREIEALLIATSDDYSTTSQLKEKFGMIRWYMSSTTKEIDEFIDEAEKESETTCESCGKQAVLRNNKNWFTTLCDKCWEIYKVHKWAGLPGLGGTSDGQDQET